MWNEKDVLSWLNIAQTESSGEKMKNTAIYLLKECAAQRNSFSADTLRRIDEIFGEQAAKKRKAHARSHASTAQTSQ